MWYLYVPNVTNLQEWFSGYTDNPYLFKMYERMMTDEFHIKNLSIPTVNEESVFKTEKDCIHAMNCARSLFVRSDDLDLFSNRNKLFSVKSRNINDDILVINDIIYENFGEIAFDIKEVQKMLHDINRLCNPLSVKYIYQYIQPSELKDIKPLLNRMYEIWKEADEIFTVSPTKFFGPSESGEGQLVWDIFDEPSNIKLFMASHIFRFAQVSNSVGDLGVW